MIISSESKKFYCKCCESKNYKTIAALRNISIVRCRKCNLTFVIKDKSNLSGSNEDYFNAYDLEKYVTYYQDFRNRLYKMHLLNIEKLVSKGPILDIGCAFGWFLKLARDFGWEPFGIEPAEEVAKSARGTYGLNVTSGGIESLSHFNVNFQAITLWNVLEHVEDPMIALKSLHNKLTPEGLLVIAVPNIEGLFSKFAFLTYKASFKKFKFPLEQLYQIDNPHMHLYHFSEDTLGSILKKCDFRVIKTIKQPVIDITKIKDRIDMDRSLKFRSAFLKLLLISGTKLLFYLSKITNLQDEIVIYTKKSQSVSER